MQIKQKLKEHWKQILFFTILCLVVFHTRLSPIYTDFGDIITTFHPRAELVKQSVLEYGDFFPLWDPYHLAGEPLLSKGHLGFYYMLGPLLLIAPTVLAALQWNMVINAILAGLFMYALIFYMTKSKEASLVSAILYVFNGYFINIITVYSWVAFTNSYALVPLTILFLMKAYKEKIMPNAMICGILLAFMLWGEHGIIFLYTTVVVGSYLLVNTIGNHIFKRFGKALAIGLIIVIVAFGLAAFKILPVIEEQKYSVRGDLNWQEASTRTITAQNLILRISEPKLLGIDPIYRIGLVALLLAILAIYKHPINRNVMFLVLVCIIAVLLMAGSFLLYFFWQYYPAWKGMRYADRAIVMLLFSLAALAGIGAKEFIELANKKIWPKARFLIFPIIIILLLGGVALSNNDAFERTFYNSKEAVLQNYALQNITTDKGIFRIHNFETTGIDFGTEFYTAQMKLENLYGYDTIWNQEYLNIFLTVAFQDRPKLWGIMNVKYITSVQPLNIGGFRLVGQANECKPCFRDIPQWNKAWGPYIYYNERWVPRAIVVENSILVVGKYDNMRLTTYEIMLNPAYDPATSVIIMGKERLNDYTLDELKEHKIVILSAGSVNSTSINLIRQYAQSGGKTFPSLKGDNFGFNEQELNDALKGLNKTGIAIPDADVITEDFDHKKIILNGNYKGNLVLSEKYSLFPGWTATSIGKEKKIERVNGVITSVKLDGTEQEILFSYEPDTFKAGVAITIITLLGILGYIVVSIFKPRLQNIYK